MRLMSNIIRISHAKFHCSRLTIVQNNRDYASLVFWLTLYYQINSVAGYSTIFVRKTFQVNCIFTNI